MLIHRLVVALGTSALVTLPFPDVPLEFAFVIFGLYAVFFELMVDNVD